MSLSLVDVGGVNFFSPNRNTTVVNAERRPDGPPPGEHHWRPRGPKHHHPHHCHKPKKRHCR